MNAATYFHNLNHIIYFLALFKSSTLHLMNLLLFTNKLLVSTQSCNTSLVPTKLSQKSLSVVLFTIKLRPIVSSSTLLLLMVFSLSCHYLHPNMMNQSSNGSSNFIFLVFFIGILKRMLHIIYASWSRIVYILSHHHRPLSILIRNFHCLVNPCSHLI